MAETESWKLEPLNSLASSNRHVFWVEKQNRCWLWKEPQQIW
jgi:hypothetical protein